MKHLDRLDLEIILLAILLELVGVLLGVMCAAVIIFFVILIFGK